MSPQPLPEKEIFDRVKETINRRVSAVDPEELELTLKLLQEKLTSGLADSREMEIFTNRLLRCRSCIPQVSHLLMNGS
jgi:hypothetical protein